MIWPDSTLVSIYKAYPRQENRKAALLRIGEALDRICAGEIDSKPRTPEEAVEWLRARTNEAMVEMGSRERRWIPHPTTWFHQSRYLRTKMQEDLPANLGDCIKILAEYPLQPSADKIASNPTPFLPALKAIGKALDEHCGTNAAQLMMMTSMYAVYVSRWPKQDLQFVPSPKRWYEEKRYEQDPILWQRKSGTINYTAERDQVKRVLNT